MCQPCMIMHVATHSVVRRVGLHLGASDDDVFYGVLGRVAPTPVTVHSG